MPKNEEKAGDLFLTGGEIAETEAPMSNAMDIFMTGGAQSPQHQNVELGDFKIIRQLGAGGMGQVYLAINPQGEKVALKTLHPALQNNSEMSKSLRDEFETQKNLDHPNLLKVFEFFENDGTPFFTMEYMEKGVTLEESNRILGPEGTIKIVEMIAETLEYIHGKGIIHRDLKPSNIMVMPDGTIKIFDFGIAKVQRGTTMLMSAFAGTAYYMAPEQLNGGKVSSASDVFSLGIITYQILTGIMPTGILQMPSELNKNVPKAVDEVLTQALQQDLKKRLHSAKEFHQKLQDAFLVRSFEKIFIEVELPNEPTFGPVFDHESATLSWIESNTINVFSTKERKLLWSKTTASEEFTIENGKIFMDSNQAFDLKSGLETEAHKEEDVEVQNNHIIFKKAGKEVWRAETRWPVHWAKVSQDFVLYQEGNHCIAIAKDGNEQWRTKINSRYAAQVINDRIAILSNDGRIVLTDLKGEPKDWLLTHSINPPIGIGTLLHCESESGIETRHISSGEAAYNFKCPRPTSPLTGHGDQIFFASGKKILGIR